MIRWTKYLNKIQHDDVIGFTGTITLLTAYGITTHNLIKNKKIIDIMNIYGAWAVGYNCWRKKIYPPLILEGAWFSIAVASLIKKI